MARMSRSELTKAEILRVADRMFLERGYINTNIKEICEELDNMSKGNLTYYFASKELLFSKLIEKLCAFRTKLFEQRINQGYTPIEAVCKEIASIVAVSDSDPVAETNYIEAYKNAVPLDILRRYGTKRAEQVFSEYCGTFSKEEYSMSEAIVTGIIFTTIVKDANSPLSLERRLAALLERVLIIYKVPEKLRKQTLDKIMNEDYRAAANVEYSAFQQYTEEYNEQALRELVLGRYRRVQNYE